MLGMPTRDALHSKTVITNQHDIHVRGLIVRLSVGCFCKHRKLDAEIDLVVGQAVERKRVLSTYPSEEITGNVLFFRKGEYFLEAVLDLFSGVTFLIVILRIIVWFLKFAAKLQYESAILWHPRKENEIFFEKNYFFQ